MQKLTVELGDKRSYPIYIGDNLLSNQSYFVPHIHGHQVCIVTNTTIAPLYLDAIHTLLSDKYQV